MNRDKNTILTLTIIIVLSFVYSVNLQPAVFGDPKITSDSIYDKNEIKKINLNDKQNSFSFEEDYQLKIQDFSKSCRIKIQFNNLPKTSFDVLNISRFSEMNNLLIRKSD